MKDAASQRFSTFLERRSGWIVFGVLVVTLLLVIPLIALAPDEQASTEPGGPVFDLRDQVDERFPPALYVPTYMLESLGRSGWRRLDPRLPCGSCTRMRIPSAGPTNAGSCAPPSWRPSLICTGATTPAPSTPCTESSPSPTRFRRSSPKWGTDLERASDDEVKLALHYVLLEDSPTSSLLRSLSEMASFTLEESEDIGQYRRWRSPAIIIFVMAENSRLGGGPLTINIGGDDTAIQKEHFGRNVQRILRGEERNYRLWGVAIDPNLESQDQGRTAIPFIFATVVAVLVVIGISLRSWRVVLLTAVGLAMLIVWLKGISNLIGLKAGLVVELIVPIAMISLGVDFAIHAIHRYREERSRGLGPRMALRAGFAGVMGALVLAMLTDGMAFFSNTVSGIESIVGFGIAAGIAVMSSFIIMGIFVPMVFMRMDARK